MLFIAESIGLKSLSSHLDRIESDLKALPSLKHVVLLSEQERSANTAPRVLTYSNLVSYAAAIDDTRLEEAQRRVQAGDIINLQFTSGKTRWKTPNARANMRQGPPAVPKLRCSLMCKCDVAPHIVYT